ncbi:MAG: MATE family efflux transporter [Clostridium sp.]|uniref:MATE family efflux transporter n=1 Tax=Clostridium sp. TaxID=1506 RepID=UPI0025BC9DED|nr:MATE family efflux transporter [Clostridium sp.]MCH3965068.1 MATE family efflux transporter [Clostridium sp.]MCI1714289.1 MATE family efflux transporter [Clostridium sp.]MCI1798551.1 MATE family efflux transporter [Clostridium sp.]MCI1812718.1 MATE family efflux transporter [Clostridium sp.]MCI1869360.1 MATE family efflux transporter [Clostridium sp.]
MPIFAEQLFVATLGMVNTMMAGHISKEAVSAIGMIDSFNYILIAFFSALAVGGTVVVAQYIGQKNRNMANVAMKQSLYSGVLISLVITLLIFLFEKQLIVVLYGAADRIVIDYARVYFRITLVTYPMIALDLIANGVMRGSGDSKTPMKITMFMNVLNVILGYIFIYGLNFSFLGFNINLASMGVKGAALGIAIARTVGGIAALFVLLRGTRVLRLTGIFSFRFDMDIIKPIFLVGIPASVESLIFTGGKLITQVFVVGMGTISIAANTIGNSIATMLNIPGTSLGIVATALIGQYMGKGDSNEAERCLSYLYKMSTVLLIFLCLVSFPAAGLWASLYTANVETINLTALLIRTNALCIPLWSIAFVLPAGLKGAGDARYTMVTTIIGMWVFRIVTGYILGISLGLGLLGIWTGMYMDWLVRGILYYARFKKGKWKNIVLIKRQ